MHTTKNKYDTPDEFREWSLELGENISRNYWAAVREMAILTGTANEGLNPRIFCGESIPSFSEKVLDTEGVI